MVIISNDLAGNIRPHVGHPRDLVHDDRLALWHGEEEFVLHADVDADEDEIGDNVVDESETKPRKVNVFVNSIFIHLLP